MIKKIWIILAAVLVVTGCKKEASPGHGDGTEPDVQMHLSIPVNYGTRSNSGVEEKLVTLDLLVFEGDSFLYRRHAYERSAGVYRSTLKIGGGRTIYFLANCRDAVENCTELVEGKSWSTDIMPALVDSNPAALTDPAALPMWGMLKNVSILDVPLNNLGEVPLLRSVAAVEVNVTEDVQVFEMSSCHVYFAPDKGYLASTEAGLQDFYGGVLAPSSPQGMKTAVTLRSTAIENNWLKNSLYLYDNNSTASSGENRYSRIVVGGKYNGSPDDTYYALDFLDHNDDMVQVVRNHKYYFLITKVNGEGEPDPDTASESRSVNMEVKVIEWDRYEDSDIHIDGSRYISINSKSCKVGPYANSEKTLGIKSNIPVADITIAFADNTNGTQVEVSDRVIKNDRYEVSIVPASDQTPEGIQVKALTPYSADDADQQLEKIELKVGNIEFSISVSRTDQVENHWSNGGDEDIEIG